MFVIATFTRANPLLRGVARLILTDYDQEEWGAEYPYWKGSGGLVFLHIEKIRSWSSV